MVSWFEKARKLWIENGKLRNEALLGLAEDLLDALLVSSGYSEIKTFLYLPPNFSVFYFVQMFGRSLIIFSYLVNWFNISECKLHNCFLIFLHCSV